jgi:cation:H+ antiporter
VAGWLVWLQFFACTGVILYAGTRLSRYADILAEKTGLGRTWIGLVGLAVVTSLPELVTGSSAILWVKAPDIAVGNLLGACVLNLVILAVADLYYPPGPILSAADRGHLLAAAFGVVMLGVAALGITARGTFGRLNFGGYLGLSSPVLVICYLMAMRAIYRYQRREMTEWRKEHKEQLLYSDLTLFQSAVNFGASALLVTAAAIWLPRAAENMALLMGWHLTMVGTFFVAAVTTLPELVVTISAMRLGAVDLAVGDLLGSLLVNVAMLGIMDLLYVNGSLLEMVSPENAGTALMAIVMLGIAAAEMMYRPQKKTFRWLSLGAFSLVFLYAAHIFVQMLAG